MVTATMRTPPPPPPLKALGSGTTSYQYDAPDPNVLEWFPTPATSRNLAIHIEAPEFTSLCPITGQPDYARIVIDYTPRDRCLESKSLKLYLMGYRNYGSFAEAIVQTIGQHLVELLHPAALSLDGQFAARGGIAFHPTFTYPVGGLCDTASAALPYTHTPEHELL